MKKEESIVMVPTVGIITSDQTLSLNDHDIVEAEVINEKDLDNFNHPNFGKKTGEITCWNLLQFANEAVKASYIDSWLDRNKNCTDFAIGIQKAINGEDTEGYSWFLN